MQARQLTSELGTAAGATLSLYGLVSLRPIGASLWAGLRGHHRAPPPSIGALHVLDDLLSLSALAAGLALGFLAGGALLGVVVPVLAFAAATGLGSAGLAALLRLARRLSAGVAASVSPRRRIGHPELRAPWGQWIGDRNATWLGGKGLVATAASLLLLYVMLRHAYKLGPLTPGTREIFGRSIIPTNCYSWALGGTWQGSDDTRVLYDSSVEQIAFGTFPWGLLAPIAIAALMTSARRRHRLAGALCLGWAGIAWIATEAFQRKVAFTIYAGFPALALAVALWLDALLRAQPSDEPASPEGPAPAPLAARSGGLLLVGLFFLLGTITLGKDLQTFPERLTSLLLGDDAIKYQTLARVLWIPTRAWILGLGAIISIAASIWIWGQRGIADPAARPRRFRAALVTALIATAALAGFWVHGWHASLSKLLSTKSVFASYRALRADGDRLVILGDLGNAPKYYAGGPFEPVQSREQILEALRSPKRVFALAPASDLCYLHRQAAVAGTPYVVLDNENERTILLSNRVTGSTDHNPLLTSLYPHEPPGIKQRPTARIVFDERIEIIGWNLPAAVRPGARFTATIFYKILAPVSSTWRVFQHYDHDGSRFSGDHVPISGRCPTIEWQAGDYIADAFVVEVGAGMGTGRYDLWTGFFTGAAPSWHNMPVTLAPAAIRDPDDRVKITSILLR
jgi:hypothetical protein